MASRPQSGVTVAVKNSFNSPTASNWWGAPRPLKPDSYLKRKVVSSVVIPKLLARYLKATIKVRSA